MRTSHAHCLLCSGDNQESVHWFDLCVCIHSWSRHLNLLKTLVTALSDCTVHCAYQSFGFILEPLCCCGLSCSQVNLYTSSLLLFSLMQVAFSLSPWLFPLTGWSTSHRVGHSPCAKGKHGPARGSRAGRSHFATPAQVRWVQAIHERVSHSLPAVTEESVAVNGDLCPSCHQALSAIYCDLFI